MTAFLLALINDRCALGLRRCELLRGIAMSKNGDLCGGSINRDPHAYKYPTATIGFMSSPASKRKKFAQAIIGVQGVQDEVLVQHLWARRD